MPLKYYFVSSDCCSDLNKGCVNYWENERCLNYWENVFAIGLKVVTNAKLLISVLALEVLKFSIGIAVVFQTVS